MTPKRFFAKKTRESEADITPGRRGPMPARTAVAMSMAIARLLMPGCRVT
jgi:hypothetical protein